MSIRKIQIKERQVPISLNEFKEIFAYRVGPDKTPVVVSEEDQQILKKAHLLSKYVPRQSNRTRWRAESGTGYVPTMIADNSAAGKLYEGDMVFHRDVSDKVIKLVVAENYSLVHR